MKTTKIPTAIESYELLKINRIQNFNKRAIHRLKKGVFVLILVIAIMLQMIVSKAYVPVSMHGNTDQITNVLSLQ